jgi:hypothetical protein
MTERELSVARLTATPTLLREMTRDATGELAWKPPKPGEWSVGEVVRHLVEGDRDTFLPRLRRMLAESRPRFDKTASAAGDSADLATLLDAFADARRQAVALLRGLDDAGWRRFSDGLRRAEELSAEKMSKVTAGMPLPPGMKFPF